MKLQKLTNDFLKYLEKEKGRAPKTIENYKFYLSRFVDFFGNKAPDKITEEVILKYRKWLNKLIDIHGEPLKKNTQNYHLIALRNFLKYLQSKKMSVLPYRTIKLKNVRSNKPNILSKSDIESLLEAPLHDKTVSKVEDLLKHRNKAILEVLFSTGLLVSEISKLKKNDINLSQKEFHLIGKNGVTRVIPLSEQTKYWIKEYINLRADSNQYLFISHDKRTGKINNAGITPRTIQRVVVKCAKLAGIHRNITPHTLRHSHTLHLIQTGKSIEDIKNVLGVSNDNSKQYT
ncbi:MAG: tyrosine-type recombinase/integrase [bacterium]|nr:tyrosine-type recombinase/integrase [bacterium]